MTDDSVPRTRAEDVTVTDLLIIFAVPFLLAAAIVSPDIVEQWLRETRGDQGPIEAKQVLAVIFLAIELFLFRKA